MRIVSLFPSATEIICLLGLQNQLIGVSHECDYPETVISLPKITRSRVSSSASSKEIDQMVREQVRQNSALYSLDLPAIELLRPDLIVTQSLCGVCAVAEEDVRAATTQLSGSPAILNLQPLDLAGVFHAIREVAIAAGVIAEGETSIQQLEERVDRIATLSSRISKRPRVAFLEWLDPPFSSGHWNPELIRLAGGIDGLGLEGNPSRTLSWNEVVEWQPEVIFIACCRFGVERTLEDIQHLTSVTGFIDLPAVRENRIYVADGSHYFNRPGPRLVDSLEMLAEALHPEQFAVTGRLQDHAAFRLKI